MKYWAFISYSHADAKWGRWLHRTIEKYRLPRKLVGTPSYHGGAVPSRLFPVFRDREELASVSDLNTAVEKALAESASLIVVCSPASAASTYVNKEIAYFKSLEQANRISCLIVDGEPNASDQPEIASTECFPEELRFDTDIDGRRVQASLNPVAADVRPGKDRLSDAKLKVIAGIAGVDFDELKQRDGRRRAFQRAGWISATLVILCTVLALTWYGRQKAEMAEIKAAMAAVTEESDALPALLDTSPTKALINAVSLVQRSIHLWGEPPAAIQKSLCSVLDRAREKKRISVGSAIACLAVGRELIVVGIGDGSVQVFTFSGDKRRSIPGPHSSRVTAIDIGDGDNAIAVGYEHNDDQGTSQRSYELQVHDLRSEQVVEIDNIGEEVVSLKFSPDGKSFAAGLRDGRIRMIGISSKESTLWGGGHDEAVRRMCFSWDGKRLISRGDEGKLNLWNVETGRPVSSESFQRSRKPSWDSWKRPVLADEKEFPHEIEVLTVKHAESESAVGSLVPVMGGWMVKIADMARSEWAAELELWRNSDGDFKLTSLVSPGAAITCIQYHVGTHTLVTGSYDGLIRLWDMEPVFLSSPLAVNSKGIMGIGRVSAIEPIPDSLRTLGLTQEGLIGIWIDDLFYESNHPERKSLGDESGKAFFIGKDRKLAVDLECSGRDCTLRMGQYDDNSGFFVSGISDSITGTIYSVVFHPDGSVVYSTKDGIFQLDSNLKNPRRITDISGEMMFSHDGQFLAVYDNGEVFIRHMGGNTTSFRISQDLKFCADFHPTSNLLASGDRDGVLRLTDPKTGKTVAEVQNAHSTFIHSVRFNSTGKILATGDHYGVIKLWVVDVHHLTHLSTLQQQEAPVLALAFRSDDQTLVAGGWDGGQLYIWKAHWKTWLSMACRRLIGLDILDTLEGNLKEFIERHANLDKEIKKEK